MAKTKKKVSSMDPSTTRRAVGPFVDESRPAKSSYKRGSKSSLSIHPDQVGAVPASLDTTLDAALTMSRPAARKMAVRAMKAMTSAEANEKKIRIFDLMIIAELLARSPAYDTRVKANFIPDYKDHTSLLAEDKVGCPGVRFEIYVPGEDRLEDGSHYLTLNSDEWEFNHVKNALERALEYRKEQEDKQRRRDAILRKMSPIERELIGHGSWRDPEVTDAIPESDDLE